MLPLMTWQERIARQERIGTAVGLAIGAVVFGVPIWWAMNLGFIGGLLLVTGVAALGGAWSLFCLLSSGLR